MPYCLYFNSTAKLQLLFEITKIFGDYFHGKVESPPSPVEELIARDKTSLVITAYFWWRSLEAVSSQLVYQKLYLYEMV
ncbi:hypothetical protein DW657_14775 [Prevotella sp. AM23-5]|nr:hypothetical protein DW657_14775 [Prevotella sp. AM23-5]